MYRSEDFWNESKYFEMMESEKSVNDSLEQVLNFQMHKSAVLGIKSIQRIFTSNSCVNFKPF